MLPPSWKSEVQEAIEETTNADCQQRKTEQNNAAANITAAINALADAQKAQITSEDSNEKKDRAISWVTLFLVFLTVVFTFLTWRTLSGQLDEMKNAGEQTRQLIENNARLAEAAAQQAAAAVKQAEATDKEAIAMGQNAQVARDNMIAAERAWVGPQNASIDGAVEVGKPLSVNIQYTNSGRAPATDFTYLVDGFATTANDDATGKAAARVYQYLNSCQTNVAPMIGQVVFPSTGFSVYTLNTQIAADAIDQDVVDGNKMVIVQGCFLYKSFDAFRHSYFCYYYVGKKTKPANLNICRVGHFAD